MNELKSDNRLLRSKRIREQLASSVHRWLLILLIDRIALSSIYSFIQTSNTGTHRQDCDPVFTLQWHKVKLESCRFGSRTTCRRDPVVLDNAAHIVCWYNIDNGVPGDLERLLTLPNTPRDYAGLLVYLAKESVEFTAQGASLNYNSFFKKEIAFYASKQEDFFLFNPVYFLYFDIK